MSERLAFIAEWLDPVSGVSWNYQLMFFPENLEVEMFDVKNRRTFLRRSKVEGLKAEQFVVGGKLSIFSRQLNIVAYGDSYTRKRLEGLQQRTLAMIKPDAIKHMGKIIQAIHEDGFFISKMRLCKLSKQQACAFYAVHAQQPFFQALTDFMSSGAVLAMQLVAGDAIQKWRTLQGPTNSETARQQAPTSLRALYGSDNTRNACHGSDAPETADAEIDFFFGAARPGKVQISDSSTLGIIKPHIINDKCGGLVVDEIATRFDVRALELFTVDKSAAGEFFEVYRGVVAPSEYSGMLDQLSSGPCWVLELAASDGGEPVEPFRQLCGPDDPEVARVLRPQSLRAKYGIDKNRNAVHCTDLKEDGALELNYFFQILQPN